MKNISIPPKYAYDLALDILNFLSLEDSDAAVVARHLISAEARGYASHGLIRLLGIADTLKDASQPAARYATVETGAFLSLDGGGTQGIAAVTDLLERAVPLAQKNGAVVVGVSNFLGTTGCLGVYAASLAEQGLSAIQFCHSEYGVAPYGSAEAILGTNPISVSVPSGDFPFIADFATAAWSYGSLKSAMNAGESVPLGVVQSASGEPSTDPNDADNGSQLPMAGHKGYALGLAIEMICGPLLGGKAGRDAVPGSDSYFAVVLRTDVVRPMADVERDIGLLFREIRSTPLAKGFEAVRIPGECAAAKATSCNEISISVDLYAKLEALRGS